MAFDIGAGLSSMGAAVSQSAGTMLLEQQKADLENQKEQLIDTLTTKRESAGRQQQADINTQAATTAYGRSVSLAQTTSDIAVSQNQRIAQNAADLTKTLSNDPTYLKAQTALLSTDPEKMAQIQELKAQAALASVQTKSQQDIESAHSDLAAELGKDNPDPTKVSALQSRLTALSMDASTAAQTRQAAVAMARVDEDAASRADVALNVATSKLQDMGTSPDPAARSALQANVDNLTKQSQILSRAAADSRARAEGALGMSGASGAAPSVGAIPAQPSNLPPGSQFSPSRGQWRDPTGKVYDASGKPVAGSSPQGLINGAPGATP